MGRDRERSRLRDIVQLTASGHGRVVVIIGDEGFGKTALIQALALDCASAGVELLARATGGPQPPLPSGAVVDLLDVAARARPLVVVVDDVHRCDDASRVSLAAIARRANRLALSVVVTAHPNRRDTEVVAGVATETIALGPLTAADIAEIAARVLGGEPGPRLTAALAGTGGNPMVAVKLVGRLVGEGLIEPTATGWDLVAALHELPPDVAAMLPRHTRDVSHAAAAAARCVAVLGPRAPAASLEAARAGVVAAS